MFISPETLLEELYTLTSSLRQHVLQYESESEEGPDIWVDLLDQRQEIIDKLSNLMEHGFTFSETHKKQYLENVYQIDQQVIPLIDEKLKHVQSQIGNMKKSKTVNSQYSGYSAPNAFGSFFDKKK